MMQTTQRPVRTIMVAGLIAVFGVNACQDATAPQPTKALEPPAPAVSAGVMADVTLDSLSADLDDATAMFLPSVQSEETRASLSTSLNALAAHLSAGAYAEVRAEIVNARALLAGLDAQQAFELAPIGMAIDLVEAKLDESGN